MSTEDDAAVAVTELVMEKLRNSGCTLVEGKMTKDDGNYDVKIVCTKPAEFIRFGFSRGSKQRS